MKIYETVFDLDISSRAKLLLSLVISFGENGCTMSNKTLEKKISCSRKTVEATIVELEVKGLIDRRIEEGWRRTIVCKNCQGDGKCGQGGGKASHQGVVKTATNKISGDKIKDKNTYREEISETIRYLNQKTKKSFREKTASSIKHITNRLNEGFTVADFKRVIDIKVEHWLDDKARVIYLRPETLFGEKFEGYLNSIPEKDRLCDECQSSIINGVCRGCGKKYD